MRGQHNISHILYTLNGLAFAALAAGFADLYAKTKDGNALAALVILVLLLARNIRSHLALIMRTRRAAARPAPRSVESEPGAGGLPLTEPTPTPSEATANASHEDAAGREHFPADSDPSPANSPAGPEPVTSEALAVPSSQLANVRETKASSLDLNDLTDRLLKAADPIDELKRFVGDIRTRTAEGTDPQPSGLEDYAARMLNEAGLFASDVELPPITVVKPTASHLFYLRVDDPTLPYLALLRIIRLEAALNATRFAAKYLGADATMRDAYRLNQRLVTSITSQAAPIDQPLDHGVTFADPDGESAVRYGISQAIESLQVPYRLVARYRTNVADGNVALELDLTPADVFPSSSLVEGLGVVPTTGDMRQRAAADYALRLGLLMAASAFRCSSRIKHVWVAGVMASATRRTCYYCVDFDRWRFSRLDLDNLGDLAEVYRSFAPVLRYEDGWLRPVKQTFHLEEERFCPSRRYLPVSLSSRKLKGSQAALLGTDHVSGLSIEEGDGRALVANAIMMRLAPADDDRATQRNVRTVMDLAGDDPDPTVRAAAERVVQGLIAGTLEDDAYAVGEEFMRGDALTRANDRAKELLMAQRPHEALAILGGILGQIDEAETYLDSKTVIYRFFANYAERALYNRLYASHDAGKTVMLVPDSYFEAHLLASVCHLALGNQAQAEQHARRMVDLAPLDARARLHLVGCLDQLDRDEEAAQELVSLLELAHEPQGLAFGYYRMAYFQWKLGHVAAAQACYQSAMQFMPQSVPMVAMELSMLYLQNPAALSPEPSAEQMEKALADQGIPLAPTEKVSEIFFECAQASLDAEIFPVARSFASILQAFPKDDILTGFLRSLEDAPDH